MGVGGEVMENKPRRQLYPGHHGKCPDRSRPACGEPLSDIGMDKCVSRSARLLTAAFASSVPSVPPLVTLSRRPRHMTRPSATSAPTPTRSSSTQPSSTWGPAQVRPHAPVEADRCSDVTSKAFHVSPDLMICPFLGLSDVLDYYLTCSRRMNSPFQQVTWSPDTRPFKAG